MHVTPSRSLGRRHRPGAVLVEFLLSFPILFIITLALFQFGILILVQQAITAAAVQGAREGAKIGHGDSMDDVADGVAETVDQYLSVHGLVFDTKGTDPDVDNDTNPDQVRVLIERNPSTGATQTRQRGNTALDCEANGPLPGEDEIRITVCVQLTDSTGCHPVPNWLSAFGLSFSDREFQISSLANLENPAINP